MFPENKNHSSIWTFLEKQQECLQEIFSSWFYSIYDPNLIALGKMAIKDMCKDFHLIRIGKFSHFLPNQIELLVENILR